MNLFINNLEFKILHISTSQHFNLNVSKASQVQQVLTKLVLFLIVCVLTNVTINTESSQNYFCHS